MKTSQSTRNIRKFINTQSGKPPRVKSLVDDYGDRVHVVKGKAKLGNTLSEKKRLLRSKVNKANVELNKQYTLRPSEVKKMVRGRNHFDATKKTTGKQKLLHKVKAKIHTNNLWMAFNMGDRKGRSTRSLVKIAKRLRKK